MIQTLRVAIIILILTGLFITPTWAKKRPKRIHFPSLPVVEANRDAGGKKWITVKGFYFSWSVTQNILEATVSANATGYVGVGFNPTKPPMKGANIILGFVKDGKLTIRDDYGTGKTNHGSDEKGSGTSDILEATGSELDGVTTLHFKIPLRSGDPRDQILVPGEIVTLIFAKSTHDTFRKRHANQDATAIKIRL